MLHLGYGYGYGLYGFDMWYMALIVITLLLGALTQGFIKRTYAKWSNVRSDANVSGAEMAKRMLAQEGADNVGISRIDGELTDNYDPRSKVLHLSGDNYHESSVASIAVACHEAGHAVQDARAYGPMRVRSALVPVVNLASSFWSILFIIGLATSMVGLTRIAVALFAFSVLFQLVTLPVEIDASRRALAFIKSSGTSIDHKGAREVLIAAALTYVAAALISVLNLLYLLMRSSNRRD